MRFRHNNGTEEVCENPRAPKAAQNHPDNPDQSRINVEVFCDSSAYAADHAVYI